MSNIPETFSPVVRANDGFAMVEATSSPHIMKPVFGTINQQFVRFEVEFQYNEIKSKELKYEHLDPIHICEITNDRMSKYKCKVDDMTPRQRMQFSELYKRFLEQKDSLDTEIYNWIAIKPSEKAILEHCGFSTVEQLAIASQEVIARIGPSGKDLQEKAIKHMNAKGEKVKASDYADEMAALRRELEATKRESQEKMDAFFARQAKMMAPKKRGRPAKTEHNTEAA